MCGIACLLAAVVAIFTPGAHAQQLTGTLSGTVYDQAGAVVPHAHVVLKNEASGDVRVAETDGVGHFSITAVQPATYSIVITAKGFSGFQENDIVMGLGDQREVPNIKLKVGGNANTVNVVAGADAVVPTDTAEIATSLTEQNIEDFPLQGRDAGELLKIIPGAGLNNNGGNGQGSSFNDKVVGSNNGPVGAYSFNGTQPNGTVAFMLDGADLVDPGNFGTQIANINQDMVANIKILTSNYGAEYAKGPVIFQAFSKSGGQQFHGEGYLYTHNSTLNSIDAYTKASAPSPAAAAADKAYESYYYIGGNVGGPVLFPFLKFNHDRNRLFFWGGYEYMIQHPAGSIVQYNVPNAAQLSGDFSNPGIPAGAISQWPGFYQPISYNRPAGATDYTLPTADIDPNIKGILALYPKPNETPTSTNGEHNYDYINTSPIDRWEATGKLDYAFSDNTKLTGSYAYQKEADLAPISIWWAIPSTLPYPTPGASNTVTYVTNINFTHVFNPTTTNEAVFSWSHFVNPYKLADPTKAYRTTNNFNVPGLFGHTSPQIPNIEPDWCCNESLASINYYPLSTGSFGGTKQVPAVYDNFTKLIGDHTIKAGFYWDDSRNSQNSSSPDNGTYEIDAGGTIPGPNLVADMLAGQIYQYEQVSKVVTNDTHYHQVAGYAQDSWRASKQLTLNVGLRFDHIGQWTSIGADPGFQIFSLPNYLSNPTAGNAGLEWQATNSAIPSSGFKTPAFYLAPRLGLAYDIFGTGKTVFRGGFAVYRYQATSETASAQSGPLDAFTFGTPQSFLGYANITANPANTPPSATTQNGSTFDAMQMGDSRAPFTNDWNATISQALPWRSVVEVSYVGNRSANEYMDGTNSNLFNLNNIPKGELFKKDPLTGQYNSPSEPGCESGTIDGNEPLYCLTQTYPTFNSQDYRPYQTYQNMILLTHAPYSNYNSFQTAYVKQSGPITFQLNYTFSKVLGIRDGGSNNGAGNGPGVDPFNLRGNYGPLAYDHTHIFNSTYNWRLPKPIHGDGLGMHLAAGAVNGWQLSGYNTYESGYPFQTFTGGAENEQLPGGLSVPTVAHPNLPDNSIPLPNGLRSNAVNISTWLGTNVGTLLPALTCNPGKNLKSGQYFNPNCFTVPALGTNGPDVQPYMRSPGYFDSDLGIYKSFAVHEGQRVEIRASAQNWLNHPLKEFGLAGDGDESISFVKNSPATCSGCTSTNSSGATVPLTVTSISPTNTNPTTTGVPAFETGFRFVTLAAKYYF
jgi:hypothetical protein